MAAKADVEWVAVNDITDNATLAHLFRYDSILGPYPGHRGELRRGARRRRHAGQACSPSAIRRSCRGATWASTSSSSRPASSPSARGRGEAPRGRREEGRHLRARQGRGHHGRARGQLRRLRPRGPPRHLERIVHDELPRPVREGRARDRRHQARADDDDPRLHGGPAPPGRAAQGPAPGAGRRRQPRADVDGRREGRRAGAARAQREAARLLDPRAGHRRARSST